MSGGAQDQEHQDDDLWLGGNRLAGRRSLDADEVAGLTGRFRAELRWLRRVDQVTNLVTVVVGLGVASFFAFRPDPMGLLITVFVALGAMFLVLGPVGALLEVLFGPRRSTARFWFILALVVAPVCVWIDEGRTPDGLAGMAGLLAMALLVFGGNAILFVRQRDRRRRLQVLQKALRDVADGQVLLFESADAAPLSPHIPVPPPIEVLPTSGLVYRIGDREPEGFPAATLIRMGTAPPEGAEQPDGLRPLSPSEIRELARAGRRLVRVSVSRVLMWTWVTAVALRLLENTLQGRLDPRLSGLGWFFTAAFALYVAGMRLRLHRRLAADGRAAVVARASPVIGGRRHRVEVLPRSNLLWTLDDLPASWRTEWAED